jgi:predicted PurR-regulated permease PerM
MFVASESIDCYDRGMFGFEARVARYAWTVAWTVIGVLLLIGLVYLIKKTLFIFIVALLFAYLLWPLVQFLEQRLPGRSKLPSLTIVYLLLIVVLIFICVEIGTQIADQANTLSNTIPKLLDNLKQQISAGNGIWMKILSETQRQLAEHSRDLILLVSDAIMGLLSHAEIVLFIVLVPILSFFFLKDGQNLFSNFLNAFSRESDRRMIHDIAGDLHLLLAGYMRAMVLLGLAAAITYAVFLRLIGLPYALLLGAIAFFCEFIPLIGPLTSATIILLVAGLSGLGHRIWWIAIFLVVFRLIQDYVLSPHLLSAGTELHPLLVIFGVLAGGHVAGIPGAFLSVPIMATLRIIYLQVQKRRRLVLSPPGS